MGLFDSVLGRPAPTPKGVELGSTPIPSALETLHFLLCGSTGTGKTTLISDLLACVIPRGDRVIVVDPNGYHLSHFGNPGDTILNPFDRRSPGWSIFNEIRREFDYDRLARSVIPDGQGADAAWHHYAQVLLAAGLRVLILRGEGNSAALLHWLTAAKKDELAKLLVGTTAAGLFDDDAGKALGSTRFILASYLGAHQYPAPGDFSLRQWLAEGSGNLYLTWREDMQAALRPLVSCWADIIANAVLSLPQDDDRRIWLILDELGGLSRLNSLEGALTRGRKHGLCVVAGLQSTAQLDRTYGRESAIVLRSCFRNLIVLGQAKSDPDTAEFLSRALGEAEKERAQHSQSKGAQGKSDSVTWQHATERLVLASELTELPDLEGFIALAGNQAARKMRLTPRPWPVRLPALEE